MSARNDQNSRRMATMGVDTSAWPPADTPAPSWFSSLIAWLAGSAGAVGMMDPARSVCDGARADEAALSTASCHEEDTLNDGRIAQATAVSLILNAVDFFGVLGLQPPVDIAARVSEDRLRKSYRSLARVVHPDKCQDARSNEAFGRLQEAFAVLSSPTLAPLYIQSLAADRLAGNSSICSTWHCHQRYGAVHGVGSETGAHRADTSVEAARRAQSE